MGAWPYPPWLVSCNERSVFVPEWTTPQLSSICLTLSPLVSLMYRAKCINPRVNNSPKCIAPKLNNMCLALSPLVSLMYQAKCINLRVNNSPKCSYPNLQTRAWPYPPWLVSCNERSVFVPEWTTPQLSSMCLTPMVSLMYRAKCINPTSQRVFHPNCIYAVFVYLHLCICM